VDNKRKKIFIVDDDMVNLRIGKFTLSNAYDVYTLHSGAALLTLLQDVQPDLILLDIMMPEMDGIETLSRLKTNALYAHLPVILLTAKSDAKTVLEGITGGAKDYIIKPFAPKKLLERVKAQFSKLN